MDMQIFIQYPKTIYIKSNGPRIKMLENSTTSSKKAILENYAIKKKSKIFHIWNASGVHEESCAADLSSPPGI